MDQGTRADWDEICRRGGERQAEMPARIIKILRELAELNEGHSVTGLQHGLQTATRAMQDGASEELIVASLCHDIGTVFSTENHAAIAAEIIRPYVSNETYELILHHQIFQGKYYFKFFGRNPDLRETYIDKSWYQLACKFSDDWDSMAFDPSYASALLEEFIPMIERVFATPRADYYDSLADSFSSNLSNVASANLVSSTGAFSPVSLGASPDVSSILTQYDKDVSSAFAPELIANLSGKVSIVIPYFEQPEYLATTIRTAKQQNYSQIEIIVVDDGSVEAPAEGVLQKAGLEVDKIIRLEKNSGIASARNSGIQNSSGEFIVTLDSDDLLEPNFVQETLAALQNTEYGGAYTQIRHFGTYDSVLSQELTLVNLLSRQAGLATVLYRRDVFDSVNGYRADVRFGGDTQFLIDALVKGWKFCRIEKPLYWYRHHDKSHSLQSMKQPMLTSLELNKALYQEHFSEVLLKVEEKFLNTLQEYRAVLLSHNSLAQKIRDERAAMEYQKESLVDELASLRIQLQSSQDEAEKMNTQLNGELLRLEAEKQKLQKQLSDVLKSRSWKLTEPLRRLRKFGSQSSLS